MSSKNGWIKVFRGILDNWVWQEKPFSKGQAWIDLILLASHKTEKKPYKNSVITYERGTVYKSVLHLADRWGWSRDKTRNFLKQLESDGMVTTKHTTHHTTVTIVNYGFFQDVTPTNHTTNRQLTDSSPTIDRQQADTIEEGIKNYKECKEGEEGKTGSYSRQQLTSQIVDLFNSICGSYPRIEKVSSEICASICERIKDGFTVDEFETVFEKAEKSEFLKGRNDRGWKASFEWLIDKKNMTKVLNGNYDFIRKPKEEQKNAFNNFQQREYDFEQLERDLTDC